MFVNNIRQWVSKNILKNLNFKLSTVKILNVQILNGQSIPKQADNC